MSYSQTQKVAGASTYLGKCVDIDGYYAVAGDNSGHAYLYQRDVDGTWSTSNVVLSSAGSSFGNSVSIYGNYFVIGEPDYNVNQGRIAIYSVANPGAELQIIVGSSGENFGSSVSISDKYIAVGSPSVNSNKGEVNIYIKEDGEIWSSYGSNPLVSLVRNSNSYFGCSVGLSGENCVIGARGDNQDTGAIYVFTRDTSTLIWEEDSKLLSSDGKYGDQFGGSVAISGDYIAAGSQFWDSVAGETSAGAVYIFKYASSWYEVDQLNGVDDTSYEGHRFGCSISLRGDYLIVGSLKADSQGAADIFYKKSGWGHLIKLVSGDIEADDDFGCSVGISGSYAIIGSSQEAISDTGAVYFFEDPPVHLRLFQEFDVNTEFLPSKASLFLRRSGSNTYNYWLIDNEQKNVIDATNFSSIVPGTNRVMFEDTVGGYTGNGYMFLDTADGTSFDVINYPVKAKESDTFYLWIRCISTLSSSFNAEILVDGSVSKTITETISNPSSLEWSWIGTTLVLPDTQEHTLGIKIKEAGSAIDKIYIDKENFTPYADGPSYGVSPYLTVHLNVWTESDNIPSIPIFIYDYKNTIDHIIKDDWYNFSIKVLDQMHGYTGAGDFSGGYFLVLSCSGSHAGNYIIWEMVDNDEYSSYLSGFRI